MGPLSKKSWWQKALLSRVTLLILLVACFGLTFAVYDRYQVERDMYARRMNSEAELRQEVERKKALEDRVEYLNNDQGLEAEIRRHFDVAREGEQVVVIVGESENNSVASSAIDTKEERSFWKRWWPW